MTGPITRTLILIRHCKSDWDAGVPSDHERPLNKRGTRDARRVGAYLARNDLTPAQVLCSDARRTQDTWDGIATQLHAQPHITLTRDLYLAEPEAMMRVIHTATEPTIALIAHCPGILTLAWDLAVLPDADPDFGAYPTGAITVLEFEAASWSEITQGTIRAFVTPRALRDPA